MVKLTKRGGAWRLGDAPITVWVRIWMRALGLPWRLVTLRIVEGEPWVEEDTPTMPVEPGAPLRMYPVPADAEWSWELPPDGE